MAPWLALIVKPMHANRPRLPQGARGCFHFGTWDVSVPHGPRCLGLKCLRCVTRPRRLGAEASNALAFGERERVMQLSFVWIKEDYHGSHQHVRRSFT